MRIAMVAIWPLWAILLMALVLYYRSLEDDGKPWSSPSWLFKLQDNAHIHRCPTTNHTISNSNSSSYMRVAREGLAKLKEELRLNGTSPCHHQPTLGFEFEGLPPPEQWPILLRPTIPLRFRVISLAANGTRRCSGGDYYETDLSGETWKSRPRVDDHGNGTYSVMVVIDDVEKAAGRYNVTVNLLYSNYHGLDQLAEPNNTAWDIRDITKTIDVEVVLEPVGPEDKHDRTNCGRVRPRCGRGDMDVDNTMAGGGRWRRAPDYNTSCEADRLSGRFGSCFDGACPDAWCDGSLGRLESNGWVYSKPGCRFHVWESKEAWECLDGKWLYFWGDSNMQDVIRNLLLFVLEYPPPNGTDVHTWEIDRMTDQRFANPRRPHQGVRMSLVFNGHPDPRENHLGLDSLLDDSYRDRLHRHYNPANNASTAPYAFIFNSGLHDGIRFSSLTDYITAVDRAASFWEAILGASLPQQIVLRSSVAPAGTSRYMRSNPAKLEVFNAALIARFHTSFPHLSLLDAFDVTFPFHYNNHYSDGGHYGRAPMCPHQPWYGHVANQYFVDLMLVHMLLTSICPLPP